MKCKLCDKELQTAKAKEVDGITTLQLACINPICGNYAGRDLNNPQVIADTLVIGGDPVEG